MRWLGLAACGVFVFFLLGNDAHGQSPEELLASPPALTPVDPLPPPEVPFQAPPPPPPPPKIWSGGAELGINGSSGNSETFKIRAAGNAKRATLDNIFTIDTVYSYNEANGVRGENRWLTNARYEWLFRDSPWTVFTKGSVEYDEFRAYDLRVAFHVGLGYRWIDTDRTKLTTRVGAGASREIGGPNNRWMPELLLGADFEHKISDRQKFTASVEVFPDLGDLGEYRAEARLGYELLVDPEWNLTLKLGLIDRYDSTPEGRKPNDIEYFLVLLWKF